MHKHVLAASGLALALLAPAAGLAQAPVCVPGNPLYDRGDYRCFGHRPVPSRARATVRARVEAARFLSGGAVNAYARDQLEDHFDALAQTLGGRLPSLVDDHGGMHTPDVRLSVIILASGSVGRVRVLSRLGDPLDRQIAQAIASSVSDSDGIALDGSEVELIVRFRPTLRYTRYRARIVPPCCVDDDEE